MRGIVLVAFLLPIASIVTGQEFDLNGDSLYDCRDLSLLQSNGGDHEPLDEWLSGVSDLTGLDLRFGDVDLDGDVDRRDYNVFGTNWSFRDGNSPTVEGGWCRADFNGDRRVNATDSGHMGGNWQRGTEFPWFDANVELVAELSTMQAWSPNGVVFARTEQFDLVAVAEEAPPGLLATRVVARMRNHSHEFVTVDNVRISGDLHQAWLEGPFGFPTPSIPRGGPTYHEDWIAYDSHLLIGSEQIAIGAGGGFGGITEENDATDPIQQSENLPLVSEVFGPVLGFGQLASSQPTDIFAVIDASPELAFARLVTVVDSNGDPGEVFFSAGLQGADQDNMSLPDMGIVNSIPVPFFYRPGASCDFDGSGLCDIEDLDALYLGIEDKGAMYDLNADGEVNNLDVDEWLTLAGDKYVRGDTDLDGDIDASDLNNLALNWQIPGDYGWSGGDFDGNGIADSADLNLIGLNWQHGAAVNSPVPEPGCLSLLLILGWTVIARLKSS